ncbi:MAG: restriction endonuclease subunit S [Sporocytophaga sp.]|nr:restriction endonuclease subunit S [Sporocytophaga sp.]
MKKTLGEISTIQTGIFAKTASEGEIVYLQAKDFDELGQLNSVLHPNLKGDNLTQKHLLGHGDILFAAKGSKNFATWYESKNPPAVASTSFFVIRIQEQFKGEIMPEFLVWFINHPKSQQFLKGQAIGTAIVSISKAVLEELEILIPDLQTQSAILKITQLRNNEKSLKQQIEILREKQIQQQIINAIK